jgi:hypothetical protein
MGNAGSSKKRRIEDQVSVTQNSITSSSSGSSHSSENFYDCHENDLEESSSPLPPIINDHAKPPSTSMEECFRLPFMFRKQPNLIRVVHQDESTDDDDDVMRLPNRQQKPDSCWYTPSNRTRHRRGSSLSTLKDGVMESMDGAEDSLEFENDKNSKDEENYLSDEEEDYTCSPAYFHRKATSNNNPNHLTGTASALQSSPSNKMFYYCYPSSSGTMLPTSTSSSSLSKCRSAMTSATTNGLLFLDETRTSDWQYTQEELDMVDGDEPTDASNLQPPRRYWIVTTAALPWMTGTAVNPLLRAAYLSQRNRRLLQEQQQNPTNEATMSTTVTLVLPWLEYPEDREKLYGPQWAAPNKTCEDQEAFIRKWLAKSARMPLEAADPSQGGITIQWYPARYHASLSSIFALGDLCELIPPIDVDSDDWSSLDSHEPRKSDMICILEEPEHVNFYRAPGRESWRDHFGHVIGIVHTNYKAYARNHYSGIVTGPLVGALSSLMVRAYCDKVVKLSPVLQTYAPGKEVVSNVHGIRQEFFHVPMPSYTPKVQCYFIGKLLWAKGLDKLLDLEAHFRRKTGQYFSIDIVGSGPEQSEIEKSFLGKQQKHKAEQNERACSTPASGKETTQLSHWRYFRQPIPARFLGRKDHAAVGPQYTIFVNPSVTEVLCTTTAEAIAMGKWVIVPRHASNEFFLQFPNCLQYKNKSEFVELLQYALANPVNFDIHGDLEDRSDIYTPLTWEAATERLIDTTFLSKREARRRDRLTLHKGDKSIQEWHYTLGNGKSGDVLRKVLGGGPVAEQSPYKGLTTSRSSSTLSAFASTRSLISAM